MGEMLGKVLKSRKWFFAVLSAGVAFGSSMGWWKLSTEQLMTTVGPILAAVLGEAWVDAASARSGNGNGTPKP